MSGGGDLKIPCQKLCMKSSDFSGMVKLNSSMQGNFKKNTSPIESSMVKTQHEGFTTLQSNMKSGQ